MTAGSAHIRSLAYYLTEACNLRCSYCYLEKRPRQSSLGTGQAVVDFLMSASGPAGEVHIRFFGGEPLLEMALLEAVAGYARERARAAAKQVTFDAVTNGTLLNREMTERLRRLGVDLLVSIDGAPPAMVANRGFTTRGLAEFDAQVAYAIGAGVAAAARMTFLPTGNLAADLSYLVESGHKRILVCLAKNVGWERERVEAVYSTLADFYIGYARRGRVPPLDTTNRLLLERHSMRPGVQPRLPAGFCAAGRQMLSAGVDGRLYLCHRFVQLGGRFCVGDVFSGVDPARLEPLVPAGVESFRHEACRSCSAMPYCSGSCMAANYTAGGELFQPEESHCTEFRAHVAAAGRIYSTLMGERCDAFTRYLALAELQAEVAAAEP